MARDVGADRYVAEARARLVRTGRVWLAALTRSWAHVTVLAAALLLLGAIDAYEFPDAATAERYRSLIAELRCPQCLNTNLAGSDAMIAQDLRREVHRLLLEGRSDEEILEYMYERYGDFILYSPRFTAVTALLWILPPVLLAVGLACVVFIVRRGRRAASPLSDLDRQRLAELTGERGP